MTVGSDPNLKLKNVLPLDDAGEGDLSFTDNPKYLPLLAETAAVIKGLRSIAV